MAKSNDMAKIGAIISKMTQEYGYYRAPVGASGAVYACMDFLSDNLRSFSGISSDIRRIPQKVFDASEALYPMNYKVGKPATAHAEGGVFFPLHMPTFMRQGDFESLWWPTFKRQVEDYASLGVHSRLFCEDDWMRYLDHLQDLPIDTRLQFEYGDPKTIKEKLGKKFILTGLFPLSVITKKSRTECVDEVKKFIDILAPGAKFIFGFDKTILTYADVNMENLIAVCDTVRDYGVYENVGKDAGNFLMRININIPNISNSEAVVSEHGMNIKKYMSKLLIQQSLLLNYWKKVYCVMYTVCFYKNRNIIQKPLKECSTMRGF